jgi:flavin reductase (DIM6/NTAB) family NADH-FMN oxidoreductase RutF
MDEEIKKIALRMIPYSVHVVGLKGYHKVAAYSGSWIMQCSFKPPLVVIGVKRDGMGHDQLDEGKVFSINFLSKSDQATAEYFFTPPTPENGKLGNVPYTTDMTGAPILKNAIAYLECEIVRMIDEHGDHILYIGKVVNAAVKKKEPTLMLSETPWHYGG